MKIIYIVPGFGGTFYCQNCIRNLDLIKVLKEKNHTAILTSMYIPLRTDISIHLETPVFFGAVNLFLKEKYSIFKYMPSWLEKILNSKVFLKWISKKSSSTDPKGLEEMTISVMKGENGNQKVELERLISWLKNTGKPDVVHLSNALLIGLGTKIKKELNIPVFCTLQDENTWIDKMEEQYSSLAWEIFKQNAEYIDTFISPSKYYSDFVINKTNISKDKIQIVPIGIPVQNYIKRIPGFNPPVIGFLSRISESLGLEILVDAYILLKQKEEFKNLKLRITGGMTSEDKKFFVKIKKKLTKNNIYADVEIVPDIYKNDINSFFNFLTLLTVPLREAEAFGTFLLEAMASGIPVVQPDIGAFAEIIQTTRGGVLYTPNTAQNLAKTLSELLLNPEKTKKLGNQGFLSVNEKYSIETMTDKLIEIYNSRNY